MSEKPIRPLSKKIISTLEEKNIRPRSRWQFIVYYILTWVVVGFAGIVTSLFVGTAAFLIMNHDWDVSGYLGSPFILSVVHPIPYIVIGVSCLLIIFLYYGVRHTRYGYKYESSRLFLVSMLASVLVGVIIFMMGINERIQTTLLRVAPWYGELLYEESDIGIYPERGSLGGIIEGNTEDALLVRDALGKLWEVRVDTSTQYENNYTPTTGSVIRAIGNEETESIFNAREIHPWGN